jgi:hypothetical protein
MSNMPCKHQFHETCLDSFAHQNKICPTCYKPESRLEIILEKTLFDFVIDSCKNDSQVVIDLFIAANGLDIKPLFEACCKAFGVFCFSDLSNSKELSCENIFYNFTGITLDPNDSSFFENPRLKHIWSMRKSIGWCILNLGICLVNPEAFQQIVEDNLCERVNSWMHGKIELKPVYTFPQEIEVFFKNVQDPQQILLVLHICIAHKAGLPFNLIQKDQECLLEVFSKLPEKLRTFLIEKKFVEFKEHARGISYRAYDWFLTLAANALYRD